MTIQELLDKNLFKIITIGEELETKITKPFCCDLLSIAMGKTPQGAAWVTVMGNINTLAVATLTDASCIVLAEGITLDVPATEKAKLEGITVLCTEMPIYEAAALIDSLIHGNA